MCHLLIPFFTVNLRNLYPYVTSKRASSPVYMHRTLFAHFSLVGQASYASPLLCRYMRDLDMIALQMGCLQMGTEAFLGLLLDKFELEQ